MGAVSNELEQFGVKLFVAHDSIAVNAEWMDAIEGELDSCHAGVAFVSPNFNQSAFCQQEVGWLLGLKKPILRMMLGDSPKALLGHKQAAKLKPKATSKEIAEIVLDLFGKEQSLSTQLINSLCFTAKRSSSFAQTDKIFENIPSSTVLTKHQAEHLLDAAELNNQVYWAQVPHTGGKTYRDLIADLIERSLDAASFADRIAELRRQATNDSMIQR